MNRLAHAAFAIAVASAATTLAHVAPARADANAPVCSLGYGKFDGLDCNFVNYDQCRASVSGTPATCTDNPRLLATQNQMVRPRDRRR